ncbi:MAG: hypothetical protein HY813_01905 [Candidatus Portnoybacteria bacterium]|nr:hypothetical protein [Candidatus Portnoybacteria bacterium]
MAKKTRLILWLMILAGVFGASDGFRNFRRIVEGWESLIAVSLYFAVVAVVCYLFIRFTCRRFGIYGKTFAELGVSCPQCWGREILAGVNFFAVILDRVGWKDYSMKCWNCGHEWRGNHLVEKYKADLLKRGIKIKIVYPVLPRGFSITIAKSFYKR